MQKIDERQIKDQKCDKRKVGELFNRCCYIVGWYICYWIKYVYDVYEKNYRIT